MGQKGHVLRSRCIGTVRTRTQLLIESNVIFRDFAISDGVFDMSVYIPETFENNLSTFEVLGDTAHILFIHEGRTGCGSKKTRLR